MDDDDLLVEWLPDDGEVRRGLVQTGLVQTGLVLTLL